MKNRKLHNMGKNGDKLGVDNVKKKKIIIVVLIIFIVLLGVFFLLFNKDDKSVSKPVKEEVKLNDWQEKYYLKLKEDIVDKAKDKNGKEITTAYIYKQVNPTVYMLDIESNDIPVMVVESEGYKEKYQDDDNKDLEKVFTIYSVNLDDKVIYYNLEDAYEIVMLYDIENKKYEWFIHVLNTDNNVDAYVSIREILDYIYSNQSDDKKPIQHGVSEIDDKYIVVNDVVIDKSELTATKIKLKKLLKTVSQDFKENSELITEEISGKIEEKYQEIEKKKKEAEEKKAKEEALAEAARKAAEKAANEKKQQSSNNNSNNNNTSNGTITSDEALELCKKEFGTTAESGKIGYGYMATVKDNSGNSYYVINMYGMFEGHNSYYGTYYVKTDGSLYKVGSGEGGRTYYDGQIVDDFVSEGKFSR